MALYDLAGKRLGVPVAQLLGGVYRERIPLSVSIANPDFGEDLDWARARIDEGVRLLKVKTGFLSHAEDLQRMERLKAILPADAELRIDYNQGLEPWDALRKLRDMEAFRPGFIEQPVERDQRAWMGEFARALDTPILADESCFNPEEAIELVRDRYADCVSIKLMKAGGVMRARETAAIYGAAGIHATAARCSRVGSQSQPASISSAQRRTSRLVPSSILRITCWGSIFWNTRSTLPAAARICPPDPGWAWR